MTVSDFIGKKVINHSPDMPELHWYSFTPTGKRYPQGSPYNNKTGTVISQYTDEKITEEDELVVVNLDEAYVLPNGHKVAWLVLSIYDLEIIEEQTNYA